MPITQLATCIQPGKNPPSQTPWPRQGFFLFCPPLRYKLYTAIKKHNRPHWKYLRRANLWTKSATPEFIEQYFADNLLSDEKTYLYRYHYRVQKPTRELCNRRIANR